MSRKAFLIGVCTLGLQYAESDVDLMKAALKGHDFVVTVAPKTKTELIGAFDDFIDGVMKTDTLILYYSGHADTPTGSLRFILDGDLQKQGSQIPLNQLTGPFEDCVADNKLLILDCCKAGAVTSDWKLDQSEQYRILTASKRLEKGKELDALKASFLTYHLHSGLTEHAREVADRDGTIWINALYEWLKERAKRHNAEKAVPVPMPMPNLLGNQRADFPIGDVPAEAKSLGQPARLAVTLYDGDQPLMATLDHAAADIRPGDKDVCGGLECVLTYGYDRQGKVVQVRPRLAYLDRVRQTNTAIEGLLFTHQAFAWNFPRLAIRLANKSAAPIHLVEAVLDIQTSEPVQEPIPVIRDLSYQALIILNEGWQPMADVEIEFEIRGLDESEDIDLFLTERTKVQVPIIDTRVAVPLVKHMPERLRQEQAVRVKGQLRFGPPAARRIVNFVTRVELALRVGHGVAPTHAYQVFLRAGETGVKRISLAQEIPPASVDLFLLSVGADRSCRNVFDLRFVTLDDTELAVERIDMEVFVPRNLRSAGAGAIQ